MRPHGRVNAHAPARTHAVGGTECQACPNSIARRWCEKNTGHKTGEWEEEEEERENGARTAGSSGWL